MENIKSFWDASKNVFLIITISVCIDVKISYFCNNDTKKCCSVLGKYRGYLSIRGEESWFYTNSSKLDKWYIRILRGSLFHLTVMGMTKMYPLWNDNKIKLLHLNRLTSCISDFVLWVKQIQILCTFAQGLTTLLFLFQNIWSRPNINYAPNNVPKDNFLLLHKLRSQK